MIIIVFPLVCFVYLVQEISQYAFVILITTSGINSLLFVRPVRYEVKTVQMTVRINWSQHRIPPTNEHNRAYRSINAALLQTRLAKWKSIIIGGN